MKGSQRLAALAVLGFVHLGLQPLALASENGKFLGNTACTLGNICALPANQDSSVVFPVDVVQRGSNFACLIMAGDEAVQAVVEGANGFSFEPKAVQVEAGESAHVGFDGFYTGDGHGEIRVHQVGTVGAGARVLCMGRD